MRSGVSDLRLMGISLSGEFAAEIIEEGIFSLLRNLFILIEVVGAQALMHQSWLHPLCTTPHGIPHKTHQVHNRTSSSNCCLYYHWTNNATAIVCKQPRYRILLKLLGHTNQGLDNHDVTSFSEDSGN